MADAVWYYADGDKEQGPVTLAQLKGLLTSGKIQPDDLVWKDGLDDWMPAEEVPELKAVEAPAAPLPTPAAARPKAPAEAAPKIEAPAKPPAPPDEVEEPPAESKRATRRQRAAAAEPSEKTASPSGPRKFSRLAGWGLAIIGLLVALTSKGCDSIGQRYAAGVRAAATAGVSGYSENAAASVEASYRFWSLGRELLFLAGAIVLVAGLATNGIRGEGAEKWLCLVMLAIITYSLFVGGGAWGGGVLR